MGKTMIARSVARLAKTLGYRVSAMAQDADTGFFDEADALFGKFDFSSIPIHPRPFILVATQGESDEQALELALAQDAPYIGFIASRKKKEAVWKYLLDSGVAQDQLDKVYSPAGIDINAKKPEEVAISILAQIIQLKSGQANQSPAMEKEKILAQYYINPVCGVPVDKNNPKHVIEYHGEKVYFCCDGCKVSFEKEPGKYILEKS
ncbi:MAG: XdhC family protein [Saprospiraceae bacterium]|nr:XdhC family protein [Saprospiraceae bacterium]